MPRETSNPSAAAPSSRSIYDVTSRNRTNWNRIAPEREGRPAAYFRDGGSTLEAYEREMAGDVAGKRILHLACSTGDEVLSWAQLGATAIGADISDVAIDKARRKAVDAGIDAEFHRADMFDLPPVLTELDLIYLSWGAICWAPDLDALVAVIAERLRTHGSVLISDHHPLWEILTVRGENQLTVTGDYFGRGVPRNSPDATKRPIGARQEDDVPPFAAFVWPVSDVVMVLIRAGLRLDAFFEGTEPAIYPELGDAARRLPAYYVIKATKAELPVTPLC
jgi:SAM-dependent methyltransferase